MNLYEELTRTQAPARQCVGEVRVLSPEEDDYEPYRKRGVTKQVVAETLKRDGRATTDTLAYEANVSITSVLHALRSLRDSGLVRKRGETNGACWEWVGA